MFCSLTKDVLFTVGELIKKRKSQDATLYKHYSIFLQPYMYICPLLFGLCN